VKQIRRRTFLKATLAGGVLATAAGAGLLRPTQVLATQWPQGAFGAKHIDDALKALYGTADVSESKGISIKAPLQAEDGTHVPLTINSTIPDAESITILVKKNAKPLVGRTEFVNAESFFRTRIKMAKTSDVHVVVKAGGKLYTAKVRIMVLVGGCGGFVEQIVHEGSGGQGIARKMKMRVKRREDKVELIVLISHPMETGLRTDKKTKKKIPAHFIETVKVAHNGKNAITAHLGIGISKNPLLVFRLNEGKNGDKIRVTWNDNKGESGSADTVVDL